MALAGAFLWALYCVLLRRWRIPEEKGGTAFHFTVCSVLAAALALWRGEWQEFPGMGLEAGFWVLFGGVGPVGLAYHWWEIGMKRGAVHFISLLAYLIPVGSSLLLGFFFKASLNPGLLPGALLIAAGAWLAGGSGGSERGLKKSPGG
jgi:drug/metabolite transporter (DMT)-like permease